MTGEALDVFISYSRRDEGLKDELVNYHLKLLQREGKINTWQDRDIEAGAEWATEIKTNLEKADIVLLLITRHFLASDYCYETEMQRAVQRHYEGTAKVIPIIMETCGWQYSDFSQLQVLPKGGKPITRWTDRAEALFDVEEGIRRVVDALNAERQQAAELTRAKAERKREAAAEQKRQQWQMGIGRRRALQIVGFSGGGLILAVVTGSLRQTGRRPEFLNPQTSESSAIDIKAIDIETVRVNAAGSITERNQAQVGTFQENLGDSISLDMIQIPAGEFDMGSPLEEIGRADDEGPQHTVTLPQFFIGRFQITQVQYEAVMGANPSSFKGTNLPVESVSWDDAVAFCEKLSERSGRTYRLPSEAEWEYACRASTTTPFHFGPTVTTDLANYRGTDLLDEGRTFPGNYAQGPKGIFREETTEVGSFPSNAFGLQDMHGNVWEWCQDVWHDSYEYEGVPTDGSAWVKGGVQTERVLRGGSWYSNPDNCRSAGRYHASHDTIVFFFGFRVVWIPA